MKQALALCIFLFSLYSGFSQSDTYETLWTKVEKLEKDGLPKSALDIVEQIAEKAKADNNTPQEIKTLLFKSKYALILEEDAQLNVINNLKDAIASSDFPKKNILENMLAHLYWQYFDQHRWQFYNRTKTAEVVNVNDFRTWDLQTLFDEIHLHFQNSLKNGLLLQQEGLDRYSMLLQEEAGSKSIRPTLYDFLNHNALQFYKTNETQLTKPAYKFEINNPKYLGDINTFSTLQITSKDSASLQLQALKIYQDLIQFHKNDSNLTALTHVNIERLKYVYENAILTNKDELLLNTLQTEKQQLENKPLSALYNFDIASLYYRQSLTYQPKSNETHRWQAKEAIEICNAVLNIVPKSDAAKKCEILKSQILQSALQIQIEPYLPIETDARLLVRYRNIDALTLKILKLSESQFKKLNETYRKEDQLKFLNALTNAKTWDTDLKNEGDYQLHSTEVLLPKLPSGRYVVFADSDASNNEEFAFSTIQVTDIALVETETPSVKTFQIINRLNGKPLTNTNVEISFYYRNNRTTKTNTYTTNNLGEVQINKDGSWYHGVNVKVLNGRDIAHFGEYYISEKHEINAAKVEYGGFIFTDRSIYRPGQTVFFKAIAIKKDGNTSQVLSNEPIDVALFDTNGQEVKTLALKTNEFGSVSGEFILPNSGLNGNYRLELDAQAKAINLYSEHVFSVEEYKRPKFETTFDSITESFKVNDRILIKGKALAYAGSAISNANVVYRVKRQVQYPEWYYWYRPWFNSEPQEITFGKTTTNGDGSFEISFKAMPDNTVDKSSLPVFTYEVSADVTDLNGETRSATTTVKVGYHALKATVAVASNLNKAERNPQLQVETRNLNGAFVATKGTIKIYKLQAPYEVLRERPWPAPDYQTLSEETFKKLFPHDAYTNEDNPNNWEKGNLVFETDFNTGNKKTIALGSIKNWKSGIYLIVLEAKDAFGQRVTDQVKTTVFSEADKTPADNQLFTIQTDKSQYQNGETAIITIGSAAANLHVTLLIEKGHKIVQKELISLSNNKKSIKIPVTKDDVGGFAVHYSFAAFNSYQSGTSIITVPYPKTELDLETITFRDKLQPNLQETWEFKIKGPKGDQVSAELLASMYDASLDQFKNHEWFFNPLQRSTYNAFAQPGANNSFGKKGFRVYLKRSNLSYPQQQYDQWNWYGLYFGNRHIRIRGANSLSSAMKGKVAGLEMVEDQVEVEASAPFAMKETDAALEEVVTVGYGVTGAEMKTDKTKNNYDGISIRKNLQETAFFFPQLKTDENGCVSFSFTTPESLTQWKVQLLAHTKTAENATKNLTVVTQKDLMVIPNAPRFLRQGDNISISSKITNLSNKTLSGTAILMLSDALTGKPIDADLNNNTNEKTFSVESKGNTSVSWHLNIPESIQAIQYKILAKSGDFSDGEQGALPVLTNRMLVTETLPMWIKSNETRTFTLDKLAASNAPKASKTLKHHKLTLEITSNPAWYAVQALPYLMEYPYDCNEQIFSRYYANALASHIANSNPRIQEVFNQWQSSDALLSNLEKNTDLKSILIAETPWLRDAENETEQKKRIALLFDLNKMTNELESTFNKLSNNQTGSGAWSWFQGGYENRFITQHIVAGFGHLKQLNVQSTTKDEMLIKNAISYLDTQFVKEYKDLTKYDSKVNLSDDHLSYMQLHYLYARSFFPNISQSEEIKKIMGYYQSQINSYWLKRPLYAKGLMALISYRNSQTATAKKILKSLQETSITSEELGTYWKENDNSWYWYQAPIETQALLIETFSEAGNLIQNESENLKTIDNLKIWLLKNKQTSSWKTTKATAGAVYALLLQGSDWLSVSDAVEVSIADKKLNPTKLDAVKMEAGTGYFKTSWNGSEITPDMAKVTLKKTGKGMAWGALYWQHFEDLDKITLADSPLKIRKGLFKRDYTDQGEVLSKITPSTELKVGDLVRVRIEIQTDRNMEFIHLKDMRAAGLEPVNVLSTYKWQDGLGYYESTKDASTNFFFDYLPKGIYVLEYDLRASNTGNMSNGISTLQSMYAPEYSSHSEGTRIKIE